MYNISSHKIDWWPSASFVRHHKLPSEEATSSTTTTCPNHFNLIRLTTSFWLKVDTKSLPQFFPSTASLIASHHTSILSSLFLRPPSPISAFIIQLSLPCTITLWPHDLYCNPVFLNPNINHCLQFVSFKVFFQFLVSCIGL